MTVEADQRRQDDVEATRRDSERRLVLRLVDAVPVAPERPVLGQWKKAHRAATLAGDVRRVEPRAVAARDADQLREIELAVARKIESDPRAAGRSTDATEHR